MNCCKHLRLRRKKGVKYFYCVRTRTVVEQKNCYSCLNREIKKTSKKGVYGRIKSISKKRITVSKKTYDEVYERDKGCCRFCGKLNIELHHIYYRSERKDLIDEPSNCIMLCTDCHKLVHSNKKKYQPILLDEIKKTS